ncbi:MAG: hypothetical protein IH613_06415 [Desulfuromonadales bacterium]|nr:hypothetical protein [Desulfuromonadales bacterium]
MEYGLRLLRAGKLPADPRDICPLQWREDLPPGTLRALYFGTEFCEDLLPATVEAESFCRLARESKIEAVLMTPIATPRGLRRVDRLLAELQRRGYAPTVSFNDWGILGLLRKSYPRLKRKAGRLINRSNRDPRLAHEAPPPSALTQDRGDRLRSLLLCLGVSGVETDPDLEGSYLKSEISTLQRVLHLPYVFAATGRNCLIKAESMDAEDSFSKGLGKSCPALCRERCLPVKRSDTRVPLWRAGNTLFYEVSEDWAAVHLSRCDRIVLHERPMP